MSGYKRHLASEKAPQPLTRAEEELNEVKASEHRTEISIETKHQVWTLTENADSFLSTLFQLAVVLILDTVKKDAKAR